MASYKNIFKITHNDVLPIQGSILIAEPFLQDAYFQRSVVLLIEHTEHGSMGFVLNKKTDLIVNSFFKEFAEFPEIPIYLGGPVSPNRLFFIHSLGDNIIPDALKINDYLYFDNIGLNGRVQKRKYAYNSGQMLQSAALLYKLTDKKEYLVDAQNIAQSAHNYFFEDFSAADGSKMKILKKLKIFLEK